MDAEAFIRRRVRSMVVELNQQGAESEPAADAKPKKRQSRAGSRRARGEFRIVSSVPGRIPAGMRLANPDDIMRNLKAAGQYTAAEGFAAIEKLMKAAIEGAEPMQRAYKGVRAIKDPVGRPGVLVGLGELDAQNGARYLKIVLEAARDTGMLKLAEDVRVATSSGGIVIYETAGGAAQWGKARKRQR